MARLLTEQEVHSIGGSGGYTTNLLCTYARAQAMGCVANGVSLASNQLVWEGSVKQSCRCLSQGPRIDMGWSTYGYTYTNNCSYTVTMYWTTKYGSAMSKSLGPGGTETVTESCTNIYCTY